MRGGGAGNGGGGDDGRRGGGPRLSAAVEGVAGAIDAEQSAAAEREAAELTAA